MSIWMPAWSVDLVRRRDRRRTSGGARSLDESWLLLIEEDHQRLIVADRCERARDAGVRRGMALAQARALSGGESVRIEQYQPERDRTALRALSAWAHRLSPTVAIDGPAGLSLDMTGCGRVFGSEQAMIRSARDGLRAIGIRSRVAIAPTFSCAWALARFGNEPETVIDPGGARDAIRSLPVRALRLDQSTVDGLGEIGIQRVGQLFELPRATLPARFGEELLLALDRALGHAIETIEPVRPSPPPEAVRAFDGPTTRTDAIERTVRALLCEVSSTLRTMGRGARSVSLTLERSDLDPVRMDFELGRPIADAAHLWTLIRPRLETAHLGFGVEGVCVGVGSIGRLSEEQAWCFGERASIPDAASERAFTDLVDTLRERMGRWRVVSAEPSESHLPERAFAMQPHSGETKPQDAEVVEPDRPTVLFSPSEKAEVVALTPDGPVHRVRWRDTDHGILACCGPERVAPEWWRRTGPIRDYFRVQIEDGRWLWLTRTVGSGRWRVHGVWA